MQSSPFLKSERRIFEIEDGIPEMKKLNPGLYAEFDRILKEDAGEVTAWLHELAEKICGEGFYRQEDIVMLMSAFARLLIQEKNALLLSVEGIDTEEDAEQKIREASSMAEVMELFDRVAALLGEEKTGLKEYMEILDAGFQEIKVGLIPATVDRVSVGDITRTRLDHIKILFFAGINDGIVPARKENKSILSDEERTLLKRHHIELAPTVREESFYQRYYLYLMMTKPSSRLVLSYAGMGQDGKGLRPAVYRGAKRFISGSKNQGYWGRKGRL